MAKKIEPFDGGDFAVHLERLETYFSANNIGAMATSASVVIWH